jgi:hypothetical protein
MPQFQKGKSGNPAGRPPGTRNRATITVQNLLEGAAESIAKRAAALVEEGNVTAIRICMNRVERDVRLLGVEGMVAQGGSNPDEPLLLHFLEALKQMSGYHLPVPAPAMALFGGWWDSRFVNPFK